MALRVPARRAAMSARLGRPVAPVCVMSPDRATAPKPDHNSVVYNFDTPALENTVTRQTIQELEAELDNGESVKALRRFNNTLEGLSSKEFETRMEGVWNELAYNLESFNPVFTACLLKVQCTLGSSDYVRRDECLRNLIQPLAGEYGMHNDEPMGKTHRKLFAEFYQSVTDLTLEDLLAKGERPEAAERLFACMMRDVSTGGGATDGLQQASYALGYNLAVEYLAAYEKTWLLESYQALDRKFLKAQGKAVDWLFLEVHAIGEPEHAELGHDAVAVFVPESHTETLRTAMHAHDRDFAEFYNALTDLLEA